MKTTLIYGALTAAASAFLTLVLFLAGYHSSAEKMQSVQLVASIVGFLVVIAGIVLGIRARRAEVPPHEPFSYGRALGAGVLVALFSALISAVFYVVYIAAINTEFASISQEMQRIAMEEKGATQEQIDQFGQMQSFLWNPALQFVFAFVGGTLLGTVIALIAAIFLRRPALAEPPPYSPAA